MYNHNLSASLENAQMSLQDLGFTEVADGTNDPRGTTYEMSNDSFFLYLDAWLDVFLRRRNPDSDEIALKCVDVADLQNAIRFISND